MKKKEVFKAYRNNEGEFFAQQNEEKTLQELEFAVVRPNYKIKQEAQIVYAKTFKEFAENAMLRVQLDDLMRKKGMWDEEKQKEYNALSDRINKNVMKLKRGGCKLSEGKSICIQIMKDRAELVRLSFNKNQLDQNTAESFADNAHFNYLVSACTVYEGGGQFFTNYEDFLQKNDANNPVCGLAVDSMWRLTTGLNEDYRKDLPEYQFLLKYKFCNDKFQLVDKKGRLIDFDGKFIDDQGRFIKYNEDGTTSFVDKDGNSVDAEGNYVVEFKEFIDDTE